MGPRRILLVAALAVPGAHAALAATTTLTDPRGDAGDSRLDIRSVSAAAGPEAAVLTIRTHKRFGTRLLEDGGPHRYLCLYLWLADSDPAQQNDYQVCAYVMGGKLGTSVYSKAAGTLVEAGVTAARAGRRGMLFTVPAGIFEGQPTYRFRFATQDGPTRRSFDEAPARPRRVDVPR